MAKNKKRYVSSPVVTRNTSTVESTAPKGVTPRASEFNPDYSYVRKDLKRIGLLAGSFFVILVVLSFFLR